MSSGGGGGVLISSAGKVRGSLLQLGVEEDKVRKVMRPLSTVRWWGLRRWCTVGPLWSSTVKEKCLARFVT
jgi:hypothetical protein